MAVTQVVTLDLCRKPRRHRVELRRATARQAWARMGSKSANKYVKEDDFLFLL